MSTLKVSPVTFENQPQAAGQAVGHTAASEDVQLEQAKSNVDIVAPDSTRPLENFIPVTRFALIDRLTMPESWAPGQAQQARRFFHYLDYWRHQRYNVDLLELQQMYEPFSPDTDLLLTRRFTDEECADMQSHVVDRMRKILEQANYVEIDQNDVQTILTRESHYGLDLFVEFSEFEEILIFYRGASTRKDQRRTLRKFMRKEEFHVPIFQRMFVLFKLKPEEKRVRELMAQEKVSSKEAKKMVKRARGMLPASVLEQNIYMKLFKNIPRSDVEMIFPNTVVRFRLLDKIKLGVTSAGGLGMGAFSAAGKVALVATNPVAAIGAFAGLGAVVFRQAMSFMNQKQRYMVIMAQNLYFHAMADNSGVIVSLADAAADEDIKEEILLYSVLCKERATINDLPSIDRAIEQYLKASFGVEVDFDVEDALHRLMHDGIVTQNADGTLSTLPPVEAGLHIDAKWDRLLDDLPDFEHGEGTEINAGVPPPAPPSA